MFLCLAVEKAISYLDKDELPPHWDRDVLFGTADLIVSDDQLSDSEVTIYFVLFFRYK